jgi:hypothetical protein
MMSNERLPWLVIVPVFALLAAMTFFVGGTPGEEGEADAGPDTTWTFMAYVMGDTNLEPYALDDLAEMASVGTSDHLNIVTMVDRSPDYSDDGLDDISNWEDTKLLEVQQDDFVVLDDLGERNTGSSDTLASFIETAVTDYPADRYVLLMWDHGGGWLGMGADETDGDDPLELDEIAAGISDGLAATDVDALDMIGFDACLMATYEVVTTLAPYADYLVASEEVEPGHGWDYGQLAAIEDDPAIAVPDLASNVLEGYAAQAEDEGTDSDITLGLIDLGGVEGLQAAMDVVASDYIDDPVEYSSDLAYAQQDVLEFGRDPDPSASMYQIDLGGLLDNLAAESDGPLADSAAAASAALDDVVLDHVSGPSTSASTGMSIYFPPVQSYFYDDYLGLDDVPTWPATLAEFFANGALLDDASQVDFDESADPVTEFTGDGVSVFVPLVEGTTDAVVDATLAVGFEDDGEFVYVLETPAEIVTDGTPGVQADYDLTYLTLGDGTTDSVVYQSVGIDPGTGNTVIDIPMDYVAPGDDDSDYSDGLLSIVLDDDGTIIEQDFFLRDDSGAMGAFDPDPDGELYPIALVSTEDDEWDYERTDVDGISADLDALEFSVETMPSGEQLVIDVSVQDYSGAEDFSSVFADVP